MIFRVPIFNLFENLSGKFQSQKSWDFISCRFEIRHFFVLVLHATSTGSNMNINIKNNSKEIYYVFKAQLIWELFFVLSHWNQYFFSVSFTWQRKSWKRVEAECYNRRRGCHETFSYFLVTKKMLSSSNKKRQKEAKKSLTKGIKFSWEEKKKREEERREEGKHKKIKYDKV